MYDNISPNITGSPSCTVVGSSTLIAEFRGAEPTSYRSKLNPDDPIYSVVKWFNPKRGFGFVVLSDGSGEALLHRSVLAQAGIDAVEPYAVLRVRIVREDRRPQVVEVLSVDSSSAVRPRRQKARSSGPSVIREPGTVKSFNGKRGYGFIVGDHGRKEVFVHVSTLERSGIRSLSQGERVIVDIIEGKEGPKARWIRFR